MIVFVINKNGEALMPCSNRKARLLLKEKKAKIVSYKPFIIQLLYGSSGYKQETRLGIDVGSKHIGVAITSEKNVLAKGEIELRQDIKELLETRKILRRSRRSRKTRYRQARFLNRNRIAYLIARENCKCQFCKAGYKKGDGWRLHHIWGKSKNRPSDWALVHESCHKELHQKGLESTLQKKKSKSFKESTFMNIIRRRLFSAFPDAKFTYGNITFQDRCELGLDKTHYNDAVVISGIKEIICNPDIVFLIKQFRKKKRSLHEATARKSRTTKNIESKRNSKNTKIYKSVCLNDRVEVFGKIGFITGFTQGGCYVKDVFDNYIKMIGKSYKQIPIPLVKVLEHNNNWQFIPHLKERDFLPNVG